MRWEVLMLSRLSKLVETALLSSDKKTRRREQLPLSFEEQPKTIWTISNVLLMMVSMLLRLSREIQDLYQVLELQRCNLLREHRLSVIELLDYLNTLSESMVKHLR